MLYWFLWNWEQLIYCTYLLVFLRDTNVYPIQKINKETYPCPVDARSVWHSSRVRLSNMLFLFSVFFLFLAEKTRCRFCWWLFRHMGRSSAIWVRDWNKILRWGMWCKILHLLYKSHRYSHSHYSCSESLNISVAFSVKTAISIRIVFKKDIVACHGMKQCRLSWFN